MFDFFIKKSIINLDVFTSIDFIHDYTPIDYGYNFYPQWWKDTPSEYPGGIGPTIKHCVGIRELFKKSVIIPSWFDMDLTVYPESDPENRYYYYETSNKHVLNNQSHEKILFKEFAGNNGNNLKLTSPWYFTTKQSIQWVWTQPTYHLRNSLNSLTVMPALIDYKYTHATNINFLVVNGSEEKKIRIPVNTPLVMLHPMSDKKVKIHRHLVSEREISRFTNIDDLIMQRTVKEKSKRYSSKKKIVDKMGCPFHYISNRK